MGTTPDAAAHDAVTEPVAPRPRPRRRPARRLRRDDGYAIALTAMLLVPLTVFTAFATDVGQWYAQATRMQRAADAAALASVVWYDDVINPAHYSQAALDVASRNGFTHGAELNGGTAANDGLVDVSVTKRPPNQVEVCISANALIFFGKVVQDTQRLTRCATAEFNLKVPLGSPRNYLGTGDFGTGAAGTAYEKENLWLAVSGYCTDRQQGDRIASKYWNGVGGTADEPTNQCGGTQNPEYYDQQGNYTYYIELPQGRTYDTDVLVWDGNFRTASTNNASNSYCDATSSNPTTEFCPAGAPSGIPLMDTSFRMMQTDSTVFDDSDNPPMTTTSSPVACASAQTGATGFRSFGPTSGSTVEYNTSFDPPSNFTSRDGWFNLCRIPSSAPAGRYILQVRNQNFASGTPGTISGSQGSNAFSLVAAKAGSPSLCDARTDTMCPRVYAKEFLSVFARRAGSTSEFFLAEVGRQHRGKSALIELWDFAENATSLQILKPNNASGSDCSGGALYNNQTFDWKRSDQTTWTTGATQINPNDNFNGRMIEIRFDLPANWEPPTCNEWFKIRATFSDSKSGQDRTTWSLKILGDPVHLVD